MRLRLREGESCECKKASFFVVYVTILGDSRNASFGWHDGVAGRRRKNKNSQMSGAKHGFKNPPLSPRDRILNQERGPKSNFILVPFDGVKMRTIVGNDYAQREDSKI